MEISKLADTVFLIKTKQGKLTIKADGKIEIENDGQPIVISGPGEYEVKGFSLVGFKNGAYLITSEEILVGYKTQKEEVDVLMTDSWEVVKNSQPRIVLGLDAKSTEQLVKTSGLELKQEKKLVLNKATLPEETELYG